MMDGLAVYLCISAIVVMQMLLLRQARNHLRESRAQTTRAYATIDAWVASHDKLETAFAQLQDANRVCSEQRDKALIGWSEAVEMAQRASAVAEESMATTAEALAASDRWQARYQDLYQRVVAQPERQQ